MSLCPRERQIQNLTPDVIEEDVDETLCAGAEVRGEVGVFVVEGVVAAEILEPGDFVVAAGETEDRGAFQFGDLADYAAGCAGGAGDDDEVAGLDASD